MENTVENNGKLRRIRKHGGTIKAKKLTYAKDVWKVINVYTTIKNSQNKETGRFLAI